MKTYKKTQMTEARELLMYLEVRHKPRKLVTLIHDALVDVMGAELAIKDLRIELDAALELIANLETTLPDIALISPRELTKEEYEYPELFK